MSDQPEEIPAAPASRADAAAWLTSALRGCGRICALLFRFASHLDAAMGTHLVAHQLKTQGRSQALSLIGSGAIAIAAFAPLMNVPVVGAVTFFNGDSRFAIATGVALVALGIISLLFALIEKYAWLYLPGFCAMLIALGTLASWKHYQARAASSPNPPATGLLDYFTQSASKGLVGHSSLSLGLPLLIYGAALVILAALIRPRGVGSVNSESQLH